MLADESSFTTTRRLQAKGPRAKGQGSPPRPLAQCADERAAQDEAPCPGRSEALPRLCFAAKIPRPWFYRCRCRCRCRNRTCAALTGVDWSVDLQVNTATRADREVGSPARPGPLWIGYRPARDDPRRSQDFRAAALASPTPRSKRDSSAHIRRCHAFGAVTHSALSRILAADAACVRADMAHSADDGTLPRSWNAQRAH